MTISKDNKLQKETNSIVENHIHKNEVQINTALPEDFLSAGKFIPYFINGAVIDAVPGLREMELSSIKAEGEKVSMLFEKSSANNEEVKGLKKIKISFNFLVTEQLPEEQN